MVSVDVEYLAAGGNRHPSAADWVPGLLVFGSGNNIALWNPEDYSYKGIKSLLTGHTDVVNAIKIVELDEGKCIISGSADKSVRMWSCSAGEAIFTQSQCLTHHDASINTISIIPSRRLLVTGSADGIMKIWNFTSLNAELVQSMSLKPHYLPLSSALVDLNSDAVLLAVAGTSNFIQLFACAHSGADFEWQATLAGHEGWIRSLDFIPTNDDASNDVILASASQDKYIRLWRFHKTSASPLDTSAHSPAHSPAHSLVALNRSLSNKTQQINAAGERFNVTFEALLIGHEDWIYTARWAPQHDRPGKLKLLSASADNSLAIWQKDESSGVWICNTRLGEISAQKGSTTATGSTGGFWIGLWQPTGDGVVSLGRAGSWRMWLYDHRSDVWKQQPGISGHTQEVRSLTWAPDGSYLISTGSDQTTRLFAEWRRVDSHSWHEFARPQIHGYDLNCVDALSLDRFISGADEKLLRVFNKPHSIARLLEKLCGISAHSNGELPLAATIPVLGLSNKAISTISEDGFVNGTSIPGFHDSDDTDQPPSGPVSNLEIDHPPFEEHLSRQTLWPEHEKLYGHGYEISTVAASRDGSLIATACKASSLEHAVIRMYECQEWREVKPPLAAHALTVTSLAFSPDDQYLLSVGRDRQWAIFARDATDLKTYKLLVSDPRGHSRMILDCSWAPVLVGCVFATGSRDKTVKIWKRTSAECVEYISSITADSSVTAIAFRDTVIDGSLRLALATEKGSLQVVDLRPDSLEVLATNRLPETIVPAGAINAMRWRPRPLDHSTEFDQLAVASDDVSLRIFNIKR